MTHYVRSSHRRKSFRCSAPRYQMKSPQSYGTTRVRATSRICPSCRRLYRLGDILPDLTQDFGQQTNETHSPLLAREQEISGLCTGLLEHVQEDG
ncbi:hypothetical protein M405DRAFT_156249 [Rhizopogon salebrosus TDB-379]|nr:hypothetical protein M405DRAFT_156249 [Rhizopogon salebrosus TDB-379]